ncbi:MAG: (2Fe-2S)-binding protein [Anaerolineaceae bacterium]|nr:(2Fe-2S)-binding protein [Anaerolineaceae bacterium]
MPKITVKDHGSFDVPAGKRLVLALEDSGLDVLHRCGGYAKCTTCRVKITKGNPDKMTVAERSRLMEDGLIGEVRLGCQILCDHDMEVELVWQVSTTDYDSPGRKPEDHITPDPEWTDLPR